MKIVVAAASILAVALPAQAAWAWGSPGHQYVGNVAERMLSKSAFKKTTALLGYKDGEGGIPLGLAAVWADCIRSVKKNGSTFTYTPDGYTPKACGLFDEAERRAMEDFARRNWTNCTYSGGCNASYHFVNVDIKRGRHEQGFAGTNNHDLVNAINASILVLQGKQAPAPFNIKDKREALFLLAHFVGDIHQPLHVGSVYLDKDGNRIDPDETPGDDVEFMTRGGNSLVFGSGDKSNLHSDWDGIPGGFGTAPTDELMKVARAVPVTSGSIKTWPSNWASESIVEASGVFEGITFGPGIGTDKSPPWRIQFSDRDEYTEKKAERQQKRLLWGGARLAQALNRIWP